MASNESLDVPVFETVEDERDFWKKGYHQLDKKLQALNNRVASCQSCSNKVKEDCEMPSAKRQRIDEEEADDSMDPFKKLGDDELFEILKYLTGKELLKAMAVSKGWKQFIEDEKILMNRAMDEVILRPRIEDSYLLMNSLLSKDREMRPYKHMRSVPVVPKYFQNYELYEPIKLFAATLETLEIYERNGSWNIDYEEFRWTDSVCYYENGKFHPQNYEFPKLRMLKYDRNSCNIETFSFPELTHLQIDCSLSYLLNIINKSPKVEYLYFRNGIFYSEDSTNQAVPDNQVRPNMKQIDIDGYYRKFIMTQHASLQVLEIEKLNLKQLPWILCDLKALKSLTVRSPHVNATDDDAVEFKENRSIEIFKMQYEFYYMHGHPLYLSYTYDFLDDRINNLNPDLIGQQRAHSRPILQRFLRALPSLKELVLFIDMDALWIRFVASNMSNLKRLVCKEITEETMQVYQEVRRNANLYKNTAFELVVEPDHNFKDVYRKNFAGSFSDFHNPMHGD